AYRIRLRRLLHCGISVPSLSASLIGRPRSSAFRLSAGTVSMSLAGSRFSSESAPRPFHHGLRRRGDQSNGRPCRSLVGRCKRTRDLTTYIVPRGDMIPPLGGTRVSSYRI